VAAPELSSRGDRARSHVAHDSVGAHLGREMRSRAEEYVAASELSSRGGRARSHRARDSVGAHLGREMMSGGEKRVAASELNSARRQGPGPHDTWQL
jgi:hypothetical protein